MFCYTILTILAFPVVNNTCIDFIFITGNILRSVNDIREYCYTEERYSGIRPHTFYYNLLSKRLLIVIPVSQGFRPPPLPSGEIPSDLAIPGTRSPGISPPLLGSSPPPPPPFLNFRDFALLRFPSYYLGKG